MQPMEKNVEKQLVVRTFEPDMNALKQTAKQLAHMQDTSLNLYGQAGEVLIVVTARAYAQAAATELTENVAEQFELALGPAAYGRGKGSLAYFTAGELIQSESTIAAADPATGALLAGATLIVKRLRGVKRPAIGTVIPGAKQPYLLLDSGANVECRPEMLSAFATMGSVYMEKVMGRANPSVGLVNNGAEETKGTPAYVEAHRLLKYNKNIRFAGNVEPKDVPQGNVDVVVCDGFTGNVILKLTEGVAKMLVGEIKNVFMADLKSKLAYLMVKGGMKDFKKKLDADEHGGALMMGVTKPVIKAHGSSNAKAFKNAVRQSCAWKAARWRACAKSWPPWPRQRKPGRNGRRKGARRAFAKQPRRDGRHPQQRKDLERCARHTSWKRLFIIILRTRRCW